MLNKTKSWHNLFHECIQCTTNLSKVALPLQEVHRFRNWFDLTFSRDPFHLNSFLIDTPICGFCADDSAIHAHQWNFHE